MSAQESNSLLALSDSNDSQIVILSPAVGYFSTKLTQGALLKEGSYIGKLKTLNTRRDLHLPEGVCGKVVFAQEVDRSFPVEYGEKLFILDSQENILDKEKTSSDLSTKSDGVEETDEGFIVTAFTTGIFYTRPSPDSPPFVTLGQTIEKGKALGLIEVMKTFNHIVFGGTEQAKSGRIKKIYVQDAQEVKSGDPLFLID